MLSQEVVLLVVAPLIGFAAGFVFSRSPMLSGRKALALALIPYLGLLLAFVFC